MGELRHDSLSGHDRAPQCIARLAGKAVSLTCSGDLLWRCLGGGYFRPGIGQSTRKLSLLLHGRIYRSVANSGRQDHLSAILFLAVEYLMALAASANFNRKQWMKPA